MGKTATGIIKLTNKVFPKVVHPFNLQNDSKKTYAMWQFERARIRSAFFWSVIRSTICSAISGC